MAESTIYEPLTEREYEVLALLAEGLSDREIAERLTVAYTTVKWYNRQIFNKLGVVSRSQAIEVARSHGLLDTAAPEIKVRHNLPAQTTPFVGREGELTELGRLLRDGSVRLVTLLAPGGMGKTRLALAAGEKALNQFANGVYFVPLASLTSPDHLVPTIADCTGFQFAPDNRTPKQQLLDYFREKSLLLILDNFEHLLDGAPLVSDILQAAPGVKIITTSRERLNLSGETVYTLGGMAYPEQIGDANTLDYSAVELFVESAQRARSDFALDGENTEVVRICQLVQGMPLAIELAAAWVGALSPSEIADEITHSLDFLRTSMRDVPERLRSVRAVFEATWQRLTADEQAVFRRLSVFRGGCTREAAQVITGADIGTLTGLVDKALLWRSPASGRYEVHELLRQYAEEGLAAAGEDEAAHESHCVYYLNTLRHRQRDLEGGRQVEAIKEIESDIENVRAAWLWGAQHELYDLLEKSLHSLWLYYLIRGQYIEGISTFEQAADVLRNALASEERNTILGSLLAREAFFNHENNSKELAEKLLVESQAFLQDAGAREAQAFLALAKGWPMWEWKAPTDQQPFLQKALALYESAGDDWGIGVSLYALGISHTGRQFIDVPDVAQARRYLEEALATQKETGDIYLMARTLKSLGVAAWKIRDDETFERLTLAALEYNRQLGNLSRMAGDLNNLSLAAANLGKMEEAQRYIEESFAIAREAGYTGLIGHALGNRSGFAREAGNFAQARAYAEEFLAMAEEAGHKRWKLDSLVNLSLAAWAQGDYEVAEDSVERLVNLYESEGTPQDVCNSLLLLAIVLLAQGKRENTHLVLEKVMRLVPTLQHAMTLEMCRLRMGQLAYEEGDYAQARGFLDASLTYFKSGASLQTMQETWEKGQIAEAVTILGDVERAEGHHEAAWRNLHEALSIVMPMPQLQPELLTVLAGTADLLAAQSKYEQAAELAAFVRDNPKAYAVDRTRAARLLDKLCAEMPTDTFAECVERGQSLELEAVAAGLLDEN